MIAIGTSLGGLHALQAVLGALPERVPHAIAIVQHRVRGPDSGLLQLLQHACAIPVIEPEDKEPFLAGRVYLAPADYHLLVEPGSVSLSIDGHVNYARPSIDVLFESAAASYGPSVVGVVLTGSNEDGARGSRQIVASGGRMLIQTPESAESAVMPQAAMTFTGATRTYSLEAIGAELARLCH